MKPATKRAMQVERLRLQQQEEFPCEASTKLNDAAVYHIMPTARSGPWWTKTLSWIDKFLVFARDHSRKAGKFYSDLQLLASNNMCRHFITHVSEENNARTRPRSARAALSSYRQRLGFKSLAGDSAIADVVNGHEAANPTTRRQAAGLTEIMLRFISNRWGRSSAWWNRQCSASFELGFVSLMRLGEIISLKRVGIKVVFKDGSEVRLCDLKVIPKVTEVAGLLFHLPWRKNHTKQDCWIPVACRQVIASILRQVATLRAMRSRTPYLFPARQFLPHNKQVPNPRNHVGHQSLVTALRRALRECVPLMTEPWSLLYSGHSLRVGGSNRMRRLGIADDVHRRLGGWMSLTSSQGYMQLSAQEQFRYSLRLAASKVRRAAFTREHARRVLRTMSTHNLR